MSRGQLTLWILLPLLAVTGWWAWLSPATDQTAHNRSGQPAPDYTLTGLTVRHYDADGTLSHILKTARLTHLPDSGTALEKPRLTIENPEGAPWEIDAERGHLDPTGKILTLPDQVTIDRLATPQNRPLHLVTRDVTLRPEEGYAETDAPVSVTSDSDRIDAVGLQAWLHDPARIHFLSKVRGHYAP